MTAVDPDQVQVWSETDEPERLVFELMATVRLLEEENRALRDMVLGLALDKTSYTPGTAVMVRMSYAGRTRRFIHRRLPDHSVETVEV